MENEFWLDRWRRGQIGFHQPEVNEYLQRWWPRLGLAAGSTVFAPLCGKSLDMCWLQQQGHHVLGVEIATEAVRDFFSEQGLQPTVSRVDAFEVWSADRIEILCGDFFALTREHLQGVAAVFDRAALIAMPPALRARYAQHMQSILPHHAATLLIAPTYPQHETNGPPFSVEESEIRTLYPGFEIERLESKDVLAENPRFRERGMTQLFEHVYVLKRL